MKYIIELTNICNFKCKMCPRNYINMELGFMSIDLWHNIISKIQKGSTILPFWRGESTLHPNFCEMIKELEGYDVVLATNGSNPNRVIEVIRYLKAVNVSLHNKESYHGFLKIRPYAPDKVISSVVEGEADVSSNRTYKRHTINGVWGKVENPPTDKMQFGLCDRLAESLITWDGRTGRCCYVWDVDTTLGDYPDDICQKCDQWKGEGRTL